MTGGPRRRLEALLTHPRWPLACAALAVALSLPALGAGYLGDDWFHLAVLRGVGVAAGREPLRHLFGFFDGAAWNEALAAAGVVPWWAAPGLHVSFFRPLSAATHVLDEALWPASAVLAHAHGLAWAGALVALVAHLYRRVGGVTVAAGLAALFFAVEDAHATGFGWLANRNAVVAAVPGLAAVLLHVSGGRARWAAPPLFAVSLLGGESAVGALGYLAAWELTRAPWRLRRAVVALAPFGAVLVAWRLAYGLGGYGAWGSALYIDPGREPLRFAGAALERWPLLWMGQLAQAPIDLWVVLTVPQRLAVAVAAWGGVALAAWLFGPTLRRAPLARFWALGAGLSMVPLCAAFPMDRLLLFPSVGAAGLLGLALADREPGARGRLLGAAAVLHGPIAAALLVARTAALPLQGLVFEEGQRVVPTTPELAQQHVVFLNGGDFTLVYLPLMRHLSEATAPGATSLLWQRTTGVRVTRVDAFALRLAGEAGLPARPIEGLMRAPGLAFTVGEGLERPGLRVTVLEVDGEGRALAVEARFDAPLDGGALRFFAFGGEGPREVEAPAAGETLHLPASWPLSGELLRR